MVFSSNVNGAIRTWNGSISSDWNNSANWDEGIIPGINDDVIISLANPYRNCELTTSTTIRSLRIEISYGSEFILPSSNTLSITGDIYIDAPFLPWQNTGTIALIGSGDQTITLIDYFGDYNFHDLTINKTTGTVFLGNDIKIHDLKLEAGTISLTSDITVNSLLSYGSIDYNGYIIIGGCTPPVTGGIYHIANDFAL